jgi:hypothetical protein
MKSANRGEENAYYCSLYKFVPRFMCQSVLPAEMVSLVIDLVDTLPVENQYEYIFQVAAPQHPPGLGL